MAAFLIALITCSVSMSALCLLALLVTYLNRKRYQPKSIYLVWLIILAGLLFPWRPPLWQLPKPNPLVALEMTEQTNAEKNALALQKEKIDIETLPDYIPWKANQTAQQEAGAKTDVKAQIQKRLVITPLQMIFLVWLLGAFSVIGFALVRHVSLVRTVKRWGTPVTGGLFFEEMQFIAQQLDYEKPVDLVVVPLIDSPMVLGLFKPRILLPDTHFSTREIQLIFRHELTHLKRRDLFAKVLALAATALHWFNPLAYLAARQANIYCESSCDLAVMEGCSFHERRDYSQTIVTSFRSRGQTASSLSTGFRGGKEEMKHRITNIMDLKRRRFAALLLVFMLLLSGISGVALNEPVSQVVETLISDPSETNYQGLPVHRVEFPAREALVMDPNLPYGGLCLISDDYEIPAAAYINGTPILITQRERSRGGFPTALDDQEEQWVLAEVKVPAGSHRVSGWIPQAAVRYLEENETAQEVNFPTGRLTDPEGEIKLYYDNGLTDQVLATFPEGTSATVIGYMFRFLHVLVGDKAGFIGLNQITFEGEDLELYEKTRVKEVMPGLSGLSDIMAGHLERFEEYNKKVDEITYACDLASPSLETRAKLSALAEEYGYTYMSTINVLPGEGDLKEEEVAKIGKDLLMDTYGFKEEDVLGIELRFYHHPGQPQERFWEVRLFMQYGIGNASVTLNAKGEPIEYKKAEPYESRQESVPEAEQLKEMQKHISYYTDFMYTNYPQEGEYTREEAIARSMEVLKDKLGDEARQMELISITYHRQTSHNVNWWMASYHNKNHPRYYPNFSIALVSPRGKSVVTTEPAIYQIEVQNMDEQRNEITYYTFSIGLETPKKGDYTREEAIQRSYEIFSENLPQVDKNKIKVKQAGFYSKYDDDRTWWLVELEYINKPDHYESYCYQVALVTPRGQQEYFTDASSFQSFIKSAEKGMLQLELEKQRGPFHTWTLEQQANFYPEVYSLPKEGAISKDDAIRIAVDAVKKELGQTEEELSHRIITCFYTAEDYWLVEFHTEETLKNPATGYFQVFIKPMDGAIYQLLDGSGNG